MKLLIKNQKNKNSRKCSNQKSEQARKAAKPARVIPFRPVDEAAAQIERVQAHLEKLKQINGAYAESTLDCYVDSKESIDARKAQIRKNMRSVGAALGAWHCTALDLLETGNKLKANLADLHKELTRALAFFGAPRIN